MSACNRTRAVARWLGDWRARSWFGWKLHWQWLLVLLVPASVAVVIQSPGLLTGLLLYLLWRSLRR